MRATLFRVRGRAAPAALALLLALAGCETDGGRASVSGSVTLDGKPLESGAVSFVPVERTASPSAGAAVVAGAYHIPRDQGPVPGVYRVVMTSPRKTGKRVPVGSPAPPGTTAEETVEAVPARYNAKSTQRYEVKPGRNVLDFALTTP